jgi:protein gp37
MQKTKIDWTEEVWNPSIGCTKISEGCTHCYAEVMAKRLQAMGIPEYKDGFKFKILPERLKDPLKRKKPTMFFVNSMSDLFYEKMPYSYLDDVFNVILSTPQHTYQILTKRAENMAKYFSNRTVPGNVWLGVTVENAKYKNRIDYLRKISAPVRFVSFEPLLGQLGTLNLDGIHWVIVGGESGPYARPMKKEWVVEILRQVKDRNIPFFFKQWGTYGPDGIKRNKKVNGNILLGMVWHEYPISKCK